MTTVHERTQSVVDAAKFFRDIILNKNLPESVRLRAKGLLRHYPAADDIWFAAKLEERRKSELFLLEKKYGLLPPALGTWLINEPLFCDNRQSIDPDM